ncbi:hypothetical protein V5F79_00190 [Xanthobacter flavus]|uniref:hypothetical protein n=1 Tax=Xanthobacter flavus TaxID=281 RepID=UPI00372C7F8B
MTTPKNIAEAIALVRGKSAAPQPATLGEALASVRDAKPKTDVPTLPRAAGKIAEGDGLPGLRQFLQDRRHGRS